MIDKLVDESSKKTFLLKEISARLQELKPYMAKLTKGELRSNRPVSIKKFCQICQRLNLPYGVEQIGQERIIDGQGRKKRLNKYKFVKATEVHDDV